VAFVSISLEKPKSARLKMGFVKISLKRIVVDSQADREESVTQARPVTKKNAIKRDQSSRQD
jgi:hypothetical protein